MSELQLSVFFPTYNEEKSIGTTVSRAVSVLEELKANYEIIVVNDGSADGTAAVVENLMAANKRIRMVTHSPNRGYGGALKSGFYESRKDLIFFTDGDGQFDFSEIKKLLPKIERVDLVVGYRLQRAEGLLRVVNAKLWTLLMRILFGLKVRDVDCAFKLIKKEVIDKIPRLESEGALISAELLVKAQKAGFKIEEVGVHHYPRASGEPTGANIKVILRAFRELFKLWRKLK